MRSDKRRSFLLRNPTDSEWFSCFMTGFEARVGQRTKQDMAINIEVMMEMERLNQEQWAEAVAMDDLPRMRAVVEWGCYLTYAFCHSLRGSRW